MNVPLRRVAVGCAVLMFVSLGQVSQVQTFGADALRLDHRNLRAQLDRFGHPRGDLLTRSGGILAASVRQRGRFGFRRVYPGGASYAAVTGYLSLHGATGMEAARNAVLSGADPRVRVRALIGGFGPGAAASVRLTIDERAQRAAHQALRASGRRGAVVVLEPATGAILALVSQPSYDPERLATHDPAALRRTETDLARAPGDPLVNRALNRSYPLGPALGIITRAARLGGGPVRRQAEGLGFNAPGLYVPLRVAPSVFPGKGARATPLEIAMLSAAVANGGVLMRPHLVHEIRTRDGTVLERTMPSPYSRAMSAKVAGRIARMMTRDGADVGTAAGAAIPGEATVATGFAPAGRPEVAVGVTVEPSGPTDGTAGSYSARAVATAVLKSMTAG
ncbi:penicillin-binding transpeptidase domain-containing protein [Spongiactinospora rosea]|nr:penicillin-binding transpeptidase domain-containing protein [Spongiactinospora rosea]